MASDGHRRDHRRRRPDRSDARVRAWPGRGSAAGARAAAADPRHPEGRRSQRADHRAAALPGRARAIRGGRHRCRGGSAVAVGRDAHRLHAAGRSSDAGAAAPATVARGRPRRMGPRARRRDPPRTRGRRAEPGRRHGDRGRARPGRTRPGDRPIPRRLRRREQPGTRPGRHPVPGHHVPGGPAARAGHRARVRDPARERRHRRRRGGQDQLRLHTNRTRGVRPRVDQPPAHGALHQRGGVHRLRRRRADDRDRARGQHPPRARRGPAPGRTDPADALHLSRPARSSDTATGGS